MALENAYLIDGIDLWTNYGITFAKGSLDDFLKLPKRKESIQHNWHDEHGLETDLSRNFYEAKEMNIRCYIIADSEITFWLHYNQFLTLLQKPGHRRLTINVFNLDYYVFYKECTIYDKLTPFKQTGKLFCSFNLQIVESVPGFNSVQTFLVNEDDLFIII